MKARISYFAFGAVLGILLMFGALALSAQSGTPKQQWEYMTIDWLAAGSPHNNLEDVGAYNINGSPAEPGPPQRLFDVLNQYAADGWELVVAEPHQVNFSDGGANLLTRYILKRAVA